MKQRAEQLAASLAAAGLKTARVVATQADYYEQSL
jgi:hypothetical protein